VELTALTTEELQAVHPAFAADWSEVFDLERALARRAGTGMPGAKQVARQLARWRKVLKPDRPRPGRTGSRFRDARAVPNRPVGSGAGAFRSGIVFAFFNALSWQIGIGTPMVLFAEQLGATPFQVGLAYSFVFVLTPVQNPVHGVAAAVTGSRR
jgi:hypothetical protein